MKHRKFHMGMNLFWIIEIVGILTCEVLWMSIPPIEEYYTSGIHAEQIPEEANDTPMPMSIQQIDHAAGLIEAKQKEILDTMPLESLTGTQDDDLVIMAKVVHAEAGNQDAMGKRLVADVLLNRVDSSLFPDTIKEVATQKDQFSMASTYTHADMKAVKDEMDSRTDLDILWFRTTKYHTFGIPAYQYGDHYFSTLEE